MRRGEARDDPKGVNRAELIEKTAADNGRHYVLRLYVTGSTVCSARAVENTRHICDRHLEGCHDLEVVDVYEHPEEAARENIFAAPTLVKLRPEPLRRIIGDLSDARRVLTALGLRSEKAPSDR
jgi:circadian clock protein KaiB